MDFLFRWKSRVLLWLFFRDTRSLPLINRSGVVETTPLSPLSGQERAIYFQPKNTNTRLWAYQIKRVLIDTGAKLNICTLSTARQLNFDPSWFAPHYSCSCFLGKNRMGIVVNFLVYWWNSRMRDLWCLVLRIPLYI
jgi:hypothetical protein